VEDDVDLWRYAILELHARNDDNGGVGLIGQPVNGKSGKGNGGVCCFDMLNYIIMGSYLCVDVDVSDDDDVSSSDKLQQLLTVPQHSGVKPLVVKLLLIVTTDVTAGGQTAAYCNDRRNRWWSNCCLL